MLEALLALVFGLLIGSFLNVCIYRLPRDLSVVRPRSYCPACERPIAWYDNVPLLSYAMLAGRCRHCKVSIPVRYPVVEALTGALFFLNVALLGPAPVAFKLCLFDALLVGLAFADLEERILPDEFTLGGAAAGLVLAWFLPVPDVTAHALAWFAGVKVNNHWLSVAEGALGGAVPALFLWLGGALYEKIRHREGMGFGDVKLMLMIGAFLGLRGALLAVILSSIAGAIIGYTFIRLTKKDVSTYELPFGSFLALTAIPVSLIGEKVIAWYGGLY
jgi:leader peptidase (prepilin peptidase)/N-methyltransferase